ncbi:MAG: histidinol dehydrogenase [Bacteroidales bacterium]
MKIIKYPSESEWQSLLARPAMDTTSLFGTVQQVLDDIRTRGDESVREYELKFDKVELNALQVSESEMAEAQSLVSDELKSAILVASRNIETFHELQRFEGKKVTTMTGVTCWQKAVAIEKVGLYIPGGTAPLFSTVLMLAVPARIAGCAEIVLCTPPNREGKIHPAILFAAKSAGVSKVFKIGGIQAIGAMAYGTQSVPKTYKIFGPGNQYVTAAKQLVSLKEVAIDMPAGPSEVQVIADKSANPAFVASDFLSQAEHGADSQSILVTCDESIVDAIVAEIEAQLAVLPRRELAEKSINHSKIIVVKDWDEVVRITNQYAPEHLILETENYRELSEQIINAGSVFMGHYTPESAGDYASGTNHTLPTNGYAKAYSGVNLDSFIKKITFQEITKEGLQQLGPVIETMAAAELLEAHKNAVTVRLKNDLPNPSQGGAKNAKVKY